MPHFRDTLATLTSDAKSVAPPVNLTEPGTGPPLMDSQNPAVKIMIKGLDLHGCIIVGGVVRRNGNRRTQKGVKEKRKEV